MATENSTNTSRAEELKLLANEAFKGIYGFSFLGFVYCFEDNMRNLMPMCV